MFSKGYVKLPKEETDLWSLKWNLHICIPNSHHTMGTISNCADYDTEELSSLQCHMEERSHEPLFLEERTGEGEGVNLWQVRDHSVFVPLYRGHHILQLTATLQFTKAILEGSHLILTGLVTIAKLSHFQFQFVSWRCRVQLHGQR